MPRTQLGIGTHGNISKFFAWIPTIVNNMPRDRVRPDANPVDPNQPLSDLDQNSSESVDILVIDSHIDSHPSTQTRDVFRCGEWATLPLAVFSWVSKTALIGADFFRRFVGCCWRGLRPTTRTTSCILWFIPSLSHQKYQLTMVTTCLPTTISGWPISQQFYLPVILPYSTYFHGLNMLKHWGIVSDRRAAERAWCTSPGPPGEVLLGQWLAKFKTQPLMDIRWHEYIWMLENLGVMT